MTHKQLERKTLIDHFSSDFNVSDLDKDDVEAYVGLTAGDVRASLGRIIDHLTGEE